MGIKSRCILLISLLEISEGAFYLSHYGNYVKVYSTYLIVGIK